MTVCENRYRKLAEPTGLEPATSHVTGERSNQLNYDSAIDYCMIQLSILNSRSYAVSTRR